MEQQNIDNNTTTMILLLIEIQVHIPFQGSNL
jgi:hypothetical protein